MLIINLKSGGGKAERFGLVGECRRRGIEPVVLEAGADLVEFGAGEPHFPTPQHIKDAAIVAIKENYTKYTAVAGIPKPPVTRSTPSHSWLNRSPISPVP